MEITSSCVVKKNASLYSAAHWCLLICIALSPLFPARWSALMAVIILALRAVPGHSTRIVILSILLICRYGWWWPAGWIFIGTFWVIFILQIVKINSGTTHKWSTYLHYAAISIFLIDSLFLGWIPVKKLTTVTYPNIVVIGDSLAAGLEDEKPWPAYLSEQLKKPVINLARNAATIKDGIEQAKQAPVGGGTAFVLIGGNNLSIGFWTPRNQIQYDLETIIKLLQEKKYHVVLFELPGGIIVEPYTGLYYETARKLKVSLIREEVLRRIFLTPGATIDGFHFSERGHKDIAMTASRLVKRNQSE